MKSTPALVLILALAACSGPTAPPAASNVTADVPPSGDVGIVASNAAAPAPIPSPTRATTIATFPGEFRGRWGINASDCDPARADNKGLIAIASDDIKFYESTARPIDLTAASPTRLTAELSFSGEGQTWNNRTVLTLSDGGNTLVRAEEGVAETFTYRKCPA